jgi:hypothetical protein
MKTITALATLLAVAVLTVPDARAAPEPMQLELKLIHIFEGAEPTHLFVIGDSGFTSVDSLKAFLGTLPPGSEIKWDPGCVRFGKEPLLSSAKDLADFRAFLKREGLSLTLVPSG